MIYHLKKKYMKCYTFLIMQSKENIEFIVKMAKLDGFLNQLKISEDEFEKIIIGCAGKIDPPLTPDRKGALAKIEHLTGMTHEFKQQRLEELLSARMTDIHEYAGLFEKVRDQGTVCVLGNEAKIKKSSAHFDSMVKVFH